VPGGHCLEGGQLVLAAARLAAATIPGLRIGKCTFLIGKDGKHESPCQSSHGE
jgi:hypothetical protein